MATKIRTIPSPKDTIACLTALREIVQIREGWVGERDSRNKGKDRFISFRELEEVILNYEIIGDAIKYALTGDLSTSMLKLLERSTDPPEPDEGKGVIWLSDGTKKGDDGDIMIASQAGGTTNYGTLFDHSGGAAW